MRPTNRLENRADRIVIILADRIVIIFADIYADVSISDGRNGK